MLRAFADGVILRLRVHGLRFAVDGLAVAIAFLVAELARFDDSLTVGDVQSFMLALPFVVVIYLSAIWKFGIHRRMWQYAGMGDVRAMAEACLVACVGIAALNFLFSPRLLPLGVVLTGTALSLMCLIGVRLWRPLLRRATRGVDGHERVLVVGAGQAGQLVLDLVNNPHSKQHAVAILDDDPYTHDMHVRSVPVLGAVDRLAEICRELEIDVIAVAIPSASASQLDRILALAQQTQARIQILPSHAEVMAGRYPMRLHDVNLDDLLDRDPGRVLEDAVVDRAITGRVVLVTGARGSIGFELCRQLLHLKPAKVIALDNNETGLFYLERELREEMDIGSLQLALADIRNTDTLVHLFEQHQPDVVFHAAAYKHVPMLEAYPQEAISVNIMGTLNLCRVAAQFGCERFVFVSTDKAVNPVNVLGWSKRIGELVIRMYTRSETIFCSVRFGNVVGSRGSAIPEFVRQIDAGGPVYITHPDVERYFMTIAEGASLVIRAGAEARGGELFMLDMGKPIKIADLVERIIRLRGMRVGKDIEVRYTGLRPGEKLTEELWWADESIQPTTSPYIFSLQDSLDVSPWQLRSSVLALSSAALRGDVGALRSMLESAAYGREVALEDAM